MTPISFEETKKIEFEILCHVASFCEKHGLEYSIAYGTLIGTIRHKGFIPWDDDIDLWMKRADYNKLIEIFNKETDGPYRLVSPFEKGAKHSFVKIFDTRTIKRELGIKYKHFDFGIDIDIFPVDGAPSDQKEYDKWYDKLFSLYEAHRDVVTGFYGGLKNRLRILVRKILLGITFNTKNRILKKAKKLHDMYPIDCCDKVGSFECCYVNKRSRVDKELFDGVVMKEFEGKEFAVPKGYHQILTAIYGDYMTPPPKDQQITHHTNNTFYKD